MLTECLIVVSFLTPSPTVNPPQGHDPSAHRAAAEYERHHLFTLLCWKNAELFRTESVGTALPCVCMCVCVEPFCLLLCVYTCMFSSVSCCKCVCCMFLLRFTCCIFNDAVCLCVFLDLLHIEYQNANYTSKVRTFRLVLHRGQGVSFRGWVVHYTYEGPHNNRRTTTCV